MEIVSTITLPERLSDQAARAVMKALGRGEALFVGGCVRDILMGRPLGDIDIVTRLLPEEAMRVLSLANIKVIPTGIDHGTVSAVIGGRTFEITTLRRDVETDGRHAVVAFTDDWAEDARRRDFTVNTLLADTDGHIYDPLGRGIDDLQAKHLQFVGDAGQRIGEDYLRILRYFRFAAQFGWGLRDDKALAACRDAAPQLNNISRERITQEFMKLLAADNPAPVLMQMKALNILPDLLRTYDADIFAHLISHHPLTRLSLLSGEDSSLVLSNQQKRHLSIVREAADLTDARAIKRLIYDHGNEMAYEVYAVYCARHKKEPQAALLDILQNWQAPVFAITGHDLIAQGYKVGPALGSKLKELEEEWLAGILSS